MKEEIKKNEINEEFKKSNESLECENLDKEDEQLLKGGKQEESFEVPGDGALACC